MSEKNYKPLHGTVNSGEHKLVFIWYIKVSTLSGSNYSDSWFCQSVEERYKFMHK